MAESPAVAVNPDVTLTAAREGFTDLVHEVAYGGAITYLTRHGTRVAAVVPVQAADSLLASGAVPGGRRDVGAPMAAGQKRSFLAWLDALDTSMGAAAAEAAQRRC